MKKTVSILFSLILISGCSSYSIKKEVDSRASIKDAKKIGIIIRVPQKSRISRDDILTSLSHLLSSYEHVTRLDIIPDLSAQITEFSDDENRFYQPSNDSEFFKYKSMGIVRSYLRSNADELKKAMDANALDGIVIYEVYGIVSSEMLMYHFDSVITIADKNSEIVYLDHQENKYNTNENDFNAQRSQILNHISMRFTDTMKDLGFLKDIK